MPLAAGLRQGNAQFVLRNTTLSNNQAESQGGGLWIGETAPVSISNSTFSGNVADDGKGNGLGGAITVNSDDSSQTTIAHTTIAYNRAGFMGGAFWSGNQPIALNNSIIAFNTGGNPWKTKQQSGRTLVDGGNNIEFPAPKDSPDIRVVANSRIINPQLATLTDNGGFAPTHALLTGSPAINTGNNSTTDQRGLARDANPDIGAFEADSPPVFQGSSANDYLAGGASKDILLGNEGDDVIVGRGGRDRLTGGSGSDWFGYIGKNQKKAFKNSRPNAPDQITDWDRQAGDRIFLDVNNDGISDRPLGLLNAGAVIGGNLAKATRNAYLDKNQKQRGKQSLKSSEAVLFTWNQQTYLGLNDRLPTFSSTHDLLVEISGATLPLRSAGVLIVNNYFV